MNAGGSPPLAANSPRAARSKRGLPNMQPCLIGMEACVGAHQRRLATMLG